MTFTNAFLPVPAAYTVKPVQMILGHITGILAQNVFKLSFVKNGFETLFHMFLMTVSLSILKKVADGEGYVEW